MSDDRCDLLCLDLPHAEALRLTLPSSQSAQLSADRARALGDVTRLRLVHSLMLGDELCVCDLAWVIESSQGLVSHHLRLLRMAGLVASRRSGKLVMYRLTPLGRTLASSLLASDDADALVAGLLSS